MSHLPRPFLDIEQPPLNGTIADAGAPVNAALALLKTMQGGTIVIPPLSVDKFWTWKTNVLQNMGNNAAPAYVRLLASGAAIRLALDVTADHMCLIQGNGSGQVHFEDIVVTGDPAAGVDCATVFTALSGPIDVTWSRCSFWGVRSDTAQQGIIRAGGRNVDISNCYFHGCSARGANAGTIALFMDQQRIDSCFFELQGTYRGQNYNKSGTRSHVFVRAQAAGFDPLSPGPGPANFAIGYTEISRCFFEDDSHLTAQVWMQPIDEPGLDHVEVKGSVFSSSVNPAIPSILNTIGSVVGTPGFGYSTRFIEVNDCGFQSADGTQGAVMIDVIQIDRLKIVNASIHNGATPKVIKIRAGVNLVEIEESDVFGIDMFDAQPARGYYTKGGVRTQFPSNIATVLGMWMSDVGVHVTAGGLVDLWRSQDGTADATHDATNANPATQPLYVRQNPAFGNRPTIRFSAAGNTILQSVNFTAPFAQPMTWFVVGVCNNTAAPKCFFDGNDALARNQFDATAAEVTQWFCGGALVGAAALTSPFVACLVADGANGAVYIDDMVTPDAGPGFVGAQGINGITIGAAFNGGEPLDGDIAAIICCQGNLTQAERIEIAAFLRAYFGL